VPGGKFCYRCGAPRTGFVVPMPVSNTLGYPYAPYPGVAGPPASQNSGSTTTVVLVVVVILVVAGSAIGAAFWIGGQLFDHDCAGCPSEYIPIGTALAFETPAGGLCPTNDTFAVDGCQGPTHFEYQVHVAESTVTLGTFDLLVQTPTGGTDYASGGLGFAIVGPSDTLVAEGSSEGGLMSMNATWTYLDGNGPSTPLTNLDTIVIDMGPQNPGGLGLALVAAATVGYGYTGTTAPLPLP
jgi:hypothetical protein